MYAAALLPASSTSTRRSTALFLALALLAIALGTSSRAHAAVYESRTATGSDDAEEPIGGTVNLTSGDIELIRDGSSNQVVGMRWINIPIPQGATISRAYIQFAARETRTDAASLVIRGEATDNAATFTTSALLSTRPRTTAAVNWSPQPWALVNEAGAPQQTSDLTTVVQEIVNRGGWASGNALAIIVDGTGKRTAWSYNGNAAMAPLLHIEYGSGGTPPPDAPPVARLSVSQLASPALTVRADGSASTDTDATPIASYRFTWGDGTSATVTTAPTSTADHTYASGGTYTVTLTATDTGGLTSSPVTQDITVTSAPSPAGTVEARVAASSDDAEEPVGSSVSLSSSDLELTLDSVNQTVGMRWTNLAIPKNAAISRAYIQFGAKDSHSGTTTLTFQGQAADNAATFTSAAGGISERQRTSANVSWSVPAWTSGSAGAAQQTPDLSAVIQEIVNRSNWASGNALAIIVTGSGKRNAWAFNGNATLAPLLHVEYGGGGPPVDNPPVARLSLSQLASPALTVRADGSASTDTDATPIASYRFTWGDGSSATTTTAPTATANHTYASAGTYTVTLTATDTGGLTSAPVSQSITVTSSSSSSVAVYVGYYDTHHPNRLQPKPSPWRGASNVTFVGTPDPGSSNEWDSSALRIDNLGSSTITVSAVVDMGGGHTYSLWSSNSVAAGRTLILAQTGFENFDGSDTNPAGCYDCNPNLCLSAVNSFRPIVRLTVNGVTTNYIDSGQVLNTHGVDMAGCPYTGTRNDESHAWRQIFPGTSAAQAAGAEAAPTLWVPPARLSFSRPAPNPTRGTFGIRFYLPEGGPVRLDAYDSMGRLVQNYIHEEMKAGEYVGNAKLGNAAAGIYYLKLRTPSGTVSQELVLIR